VREQRLRERALVVRRIRIGRWSRAGQRHEARSRAFRGRKMLERGVYGSTDDLAKIKGKTYVSQVLRLTLPAPEIVQAILDGRQPAELQPEDLPYVFPLEREEQCQFGGVDATHC
jgi:hypothetical protein